MISQRDADFLQWAIELGGRSPPSMTSFSVGALIVAPTGQVLSGGHTRELGEGWHAEEAAIEKARRAGLDLASSTLYASIEPCAERLSGRICCADHIIAAGISRVVYCVDEPPVFVEPHGREKLLGAGIAVERDDRLAEAVWRQNEGAIARHAG